MRKKTRNRGVRMLSKNRRIWANEELRRRCLTAEDLAAQITTDETISCEISHDTVTKFLNAKNIDRDKFAAIANKLRKSPEWLLEPETISTAPRDAVRYFSGLSRYKRIDALKRYFRENEKRSISIVGRRGQGKTELVIKLIEDDLATTNPTFTGGYCFVRANLENIGSQIENFFLEFGEQNDINLGKPPECIKGDTKAIVHWYYKNFPFDDRLVLIVFDSVKDYTSISSYLPHDQVAKIFKVIITTTKRDISISMFKDVYLENLKEDEAIGLLNQIVDDKSYTYEYYEEVSRISRLVGYLPIALGLIGKYIKRRKRQDNLFKNIITQLESNSGLAKVVCTVEPDIGYADQLIEGKLLDDLQKHGLRAVFDLTWNDYNDHFNSHTSEIQKVAYVISLFAPSPLNFSLIKDCFPEIDEYTIGEIVFDELVAQSFLDRNNDGSFQYHELIRKFVREKKALVENTQKLEEKVILGLNKQTETHHRWIKFSSSKQPLLISHLEYLLEDSEEISDITAIMTDDDLLHFCLFIIPYFHVNYLFLESEKYIYKAFLHLNENIGDRIQILRHQATFFKSQNRIAECLRNLDEVIQLAESYKDNTSLYSIEHFNWSFHFLIACIDAYGICVEVNYDDQLEKYSEKILSQLPMIDNEHYYYSYMPLFAEFFHEQARFFLSKDELDSSLSTALTGEQFVFCLCNRINLKDFTVNLENENATSIKNKSYLGKIIDDLYQLIIRLFFEMKRIREGRVYINRTINLREQLGLAKDVSTGHLYYNWGKMCFDYKVDIEKGIDYFYNALIVYKNVGNDEGFEITVNFINSLITSLNKNQDYEKAREFSLRLQLIQENDEGESPIF